MKSRWLACVLALTVLPACFLDQTPPKPSDKPASPPYQGRVALEDVRGHHTQASFSAIFGKKTEAPNAVSLRSYQLALQASATPRAQAPQCEFAKAPKTPARASDTSAYLNVGKMLFGPALQSSGTQVPQNDKNIYFTELTPGVPAGLYSVVASGAGEIAKFGDVLSMPEEVREATGNNVRFEDGIPLLQGQALTIAWDKPAMENESNYLLVDFYAETETEKFQVHCWAMEAAFGSSTPRLNWEIPATEMAKIPSTPAAALDFVRAHVRNASNAQVDVQFQGIRTYLAAAAIFKPTDPMP